MRSSADRRREQEDLLNPDLDNVRPNEPPRPIDDVNRCNGRMGEHDFSAVGKGPEGFEDERGSQVVRCWYCSQLSPFSANRIAKWEQTQEVRRNV